MRFWRKKKPEYQTLQNLMDEKLAQAAKVYAEEIDKQIFQPKSVFVSIVISGADKILVPVFKKLPWYRIWGPRIKDAWLVLIGKEFVCKCEDDEDW